MNTNCDQSCTQLKKIQFTEGFITCRVQPHVQWVAKDHKGLDAKYYKEVTNKWGVKEYPLILWEIEEFKAAIDERLTGSENVETELKKSADLATSSKDIPFGQEYNVLDDLYESGPINNNVNLPEAKPSPCSWNTPLSAYCNYIISKSPSISGAYTPETGYVPINSNTLTLGIFW